MSEGLLGLIGVAVGAGLTFAFTMLSNWQANRAEQKRIRNRVLYYLFEIHNRLGKLVEAPPIEAIFDEYVHQRPQLREAGFEMPKEIWVQLRIPMQISLQKAIIDDLSTIKDSYPSAIQDLSSIFPTASFRLHNLNNTLGRLEHFFSSYNDEVSQVLGSDMAQSAISEGKGKFTPTFIKQSLDQIEEVAMELVQGVLNWKTRREATAIFKENLEVDLDEDKKLLFEAFDAFVPQMVSALAPPQEATGPNLPNEEE